MISPSSTTGVGQALRRAREKRGESLLQAAQATRISEDYLRALERDAPIYSFPAPVYARFFLRSYARHLQLDEERLLRAFVARHGQEDSPPVPVLPTTDIVSRRPPDGPPSLLSTRKPLWARDPATSVRVPSLRSAAVRRRVARRSSNGGGGKGRRTAMHVLVAMALLVVVAVPSWFLLRSDSKTEAGGAGGPTHAEGASREPLQLPRGGREIFPKYQVVALYGAPNTPELGVLGLGPAEAGRRLLKQAKPYEMGGKPVMPAFELIGAVATREPGDAGLYRARMSDESIQAYLDEIRKLKGILVIDIQPGRSDFLTEAKVLEKFLRQPDVGLALDPEWRMGPGQVPGVQIGSVQAAEVNRVIDYLTGIVKRHNLPQKILIVHQFTKDMVKDKNSIDRPPEVAVTFNVDGFGGREAKLSKYQSFTIGKQDRYFYGFKLFYEQDIGLLEPVDVLNLFPKPSFVVYQ